MKVVGIISGTSFDAIETAAADLRLEGDAVVLRPLGSRGVPYDTGLRTAVAEALPPAATTAGGVCMLDTRLGRAFAEAAADATLAFCGGHADLIVSHGQTVFHWVEGEKALGTLQLGQPAWIADRTGSPVVSDLRSRDIAAGGQGAPLASIFDVLLLGSGERRRAALNLGGIANITVVPDGEAGDTPFAFDVGPANALLDAAVEYLTDGSETYDHEGRRAARGGIHEGLLRSLLAEPYYGLGPPKSTGKELFNLPYLLERLAPFGDIEADDLVATVTALTSRTVADALERYDILEVVASGGGTSNPTLMGMLREDAKEVRLRRIEDWGIPSGAKEAYAFALMGFLSVHGLPSNVPSCTGARSAVVLGSVTPGRSPLVLPDPAPRAPDHLRIED
ncbi:MAG TPA: anhydro-N-acetylmuramic acid kinase [Rubrobacter sp.]|nr:anhydro-N-acetylmuramic acid kinase [Rubrobacter sp.]